MLSCFLYPPEWQLNTTRCSSVLKWLNAMCWMRSASQNIVPKVILLLSVWISEGGEQQMVQPEYCCCFKHFTKSPSHGLIQTLVWMRYNAAGSAAAAAQPFNLGVFDPEEHLGIGVSVALLFLRSPFPIMFAFLTSLGKELLSRQRLETWAWGESKSGYRHRAFHLKLTALNMVCIGSNCLWK